MRLKEIVESEEFQTNFGRKPTYHDMARVRDGKEREGEELIENGRYNFWGDSSKITKDGQFVHEQYKVSMYCDRFYLFKLWYLCAKPYLSEPVLSLIRLRLRRSHKKLMELKLWRMILIISGSSYSTSMLEKREWNWMSGIFDPISGKTEAISQDRFQQALPF